MATFTMKNTDQSVAILGAGITGLTLAWSLKEKGVPVTVYEKKGFPGGVIQSQHSNGWMMENGPNTILVKKQEIWDLLNDLELQGEIIKPGPEAQKRYIIRERKLRPVPMSVKEFLTTDLISTVAKFRLFKEPFITASNKPDESIASFIRRRLGPELLDYGVNPFVSGVYAGDPKSLSVKHTFSSLYEMEQSYGSLARALMQRKEKNRSKRALISFQEGLQTLPSALAEQLGNALQLNTAAQKIQQTAAGWQVETAGGSTNHPMLVSTLPTHLLPKVWGSENSADAIRQLADISYVPMSVLGLGFERGQVNHPLDGFGMLIPERESYAMLGCLFSSSLFERRAPQGRVLLTCFIGGARDPELAASPTSSLLNIAGPELEQLLGVRGEPVFKTHTYWPKAIPQYTVGYDTYLQAMKQVEDANPGFFLAGNFRHGVSVPDCISNGLAAAEKVYHYRQNKR